LISFFVEAGLVNCINCNPVPRGTQGALNSGLPSVDSGLQLDLEIALCGVSAPNAFGVETSDDVIWEAFTIIAAICRALLYTPDGVRLNDAESSSIALAKA
jgi:hypothetical protein